MKKALFLLVVVAISTMALLYKSQMLTREKAPDHIEYNYTYDKKEVFNDDASSDLAELDKNIKDLSEKAASASDTVKTNAQVKIQKLSDERVALAKKLEALKNANESNWNDLKSDFQKSEYEMKTSLKETWQWLAEKTPS
jgi:hypothetical protein